jgi:hypothetical protein
MKMNPDCSGLNKIFGLSDEIVLCFDDIDFTPTTSISWMKGRKMDAAHKEKIRESNLGVKRSASTKARMKKAKSEEHKNKIAASKIGKARPTQLCEHCNRQIAAGNFNRWHGSNCKEAPNAV